MVFAVKHYAEATELRELRGTLLDILIDSRYQLVAALEQPYDPANDVVRSWFVESWRRLAPVVRRIALQQEDKEPLMWISVLAATDALYALDQLGLDLTCDSLAVQDDGGHFLPPAPFWRLIRSSERPDRAPEPDVLVLAPDSVARTTRSGARTPIVRREGTEGVLLEGSAPVVAAFARRISAGSAVRR